MPYLMFYVSEILMTYILTKESCQITGLCFYSRTIQREPIHNLIFFFCLPWIWIFYLKEKTNCHSKHLRVGRQQAACLLFIFSISGNKCISQTYCLSVHIYYQKKLFSLVVVRQYVPRDIFLKQIIKLVPKMFFKQEKKKNYLHTQKFLSEEK